jgi:Tfp pilus assembly PilM family ATPase
VANIFFGRGKKKRLIAEASRMGLRGLLLESDGELLVVDKAVSLSWPHHLSQSPDEFAQQLTSMTQSLAEQFSPKQHTVVFCASDASNMDRYIQTPVIEDEEELEDFLQGRKLMNTEEHLSDIHRVGPSISELKSSQDILIHSVHKNLAQSVMDAIEDAGYELEALEFPANAMIGYYDYFCTEGRTDHDAMISIGWEVSQLSIFREGHLAFSHILNFRLSDFMGLLMRKLELDESTAKELTRNDLLQVLLEGKESRYTYPEEVLAEVRTDLEYLADELKRVVAFYVCRVMEWKIEGIERLIFTGMETEILPLYNYLASGFLVPATSINPVSEIEFSDQVSAKFQDTAAREVFCLSLGLGLRYIE